MQKKLIALAIAGLSGAAFAQSNVTVYGIADAFFGQYSTQGIKATVVDSGGLATSRLGFNGTENLGNGLSAIFGIEYGIDYATQGSIGVIPTGGSVGAITNSNAAGGLVGYARQQYVGLKGGFGQVTLGRQYAPGYLAVVRNDAFGGAVVAAQYAILASSFTGIAMVDSSASRWNNSIAYESPLMSGFTARGVYSFGQTNEVVSDTLNLDADKRASLAVQYANGPLNLDAVYYTFKSGTTKTVSQTTQDEWYLGGSYNFGPATLKLTWQQKNDKSTFDNDYSAWNLGTQVPVGAAGTVVAEYVKLTPKGLTASTKDAKGYSLGYLYGLSKRTTLYAAYTHITNGATAEASYYKAVAGQSNNTWGLGVDHKF